MKKIITGIMSAVGLGTPARHPQEGKADGDVMQGLRQQALSLKPEQIGISRTNFPKEVWGMLMETGYEKATVSLVVLADGTASLYFSSGGGIIGAGQHESVRKASSNFLGWANQYFSSASRTESYPLPGLGQVTFYFLTYDGVHSYSAQEIELGEGRNNLSNLFHAGHEVIARMREIEQARH